MRGILPHTGSPNACALLIESVFQCARAAAVVLFESERVSLLILAKPVDLFCLLPPKYAHSFC